MNGLLNSNNEMSDKSAARYENTGLLNTKCTNIVIIQLIFEGLQTWVAYVHLLTIVYADILWKNNYFRVCCTLLKKIHKFVQYCATLSVWLNCNLRWSFLRNFYLIKILLCKPTFFPFYSWSTIFAQIAMAYSVFMRLGYCLAASLNSGRFIVNLKFNDKHKQC